MRRGPLVLGLFVLMALCAAATDARAADSPAGSSDWCLADPSQAFTPEPARPFSPGPESPLCVRGSTSPDCQAQDPANRPTPPAPSSFAAPDLAPTAAPELPDPDAATAPLPPGCLGSPRPGFARALFRPPRV